MVFRSPKYTPPVSSRTTTKSKPPPINSSFSGQAFFNCGNKSAGRRLQKSPNPLRMARSPASGRRLGGSSYHFDSPTLPPTAPSSTESLSLAVLRASSVNGTPVASMETPPISTSLYLNSCPYFVPTASSTLHASRTISGPIPSPGITAIL